MIHYGHIVVLAVAALLAGGCGIKAPSAALINAAMSSTNVVFQVSGQEPIPLSTREIATIKAIVQRFADRPHVLKKTLPVCYGSFAAGPVWLGWTGPGLCLYDQATERYHVVEDPLLVKMKQLYILKITGPTPPLRSLARDQWQQVLAMLENPK
jgi:hypothetical protein